MLCALCLGLIRTPPPGDAPLLEVCCVLLLGMSRISPLQNAHNKGLFGDYQEKNEDNLLKIKEITNLRYKITLHHRKYRHERSIA